MPNAVNMQVSGSTLYVSGTLSAGANMRIEVPLTVSSLSVSGSIIGDLYVSGTLTALELKTTVISSSIIYRSGSTKSGDSLDDVHEVTGSLIVVGNIRGALTGTMTGSLTGSVLAVNGLSGSLQRLATGETYLAAGPHITIITQSNGQVQVSAEGLGDVSASYVVLSFTGSLPNERVLSASVGLLLTDNGPGNTVDLRINDREVATLSGSIFGGRLYASGGLTGSLQEVIPGTAYLTATGSAITVVTQSNGQVRVGLVKPDLVGQLLFAVTADQFVKALPITSEAGWLVNNDGILLVSSSN